MELNLKNQWFIAVIIYIGQMMVGFNLGWTAPIIPKLEDPAQTPLLSVISSSQAAWIASVIYIGTIIGPFLSAYFSNVYGRKPTLMLCGIVTISSFLLLALASNLSMIYAGRILTGLGTGAMFVINFVYIGEIASTNIRGILLSGIGIFSTLGTVLVYSIGPYVPYSVTSFIALGITVVYVIGLVFIPETPLFYVLQGKENEANKVLISLGRKEDVDKLSLPKHNNFRQKNQWKDLFTVKSNRRALTITSTLVLLQQLSGIVVVQFFATTIFELAGSSVEPNIATIIIGITQLTSSSITPWFVERNGRKVLLLVSTGIACFSLAMLGTYFFLDYLELSIVKQMQWLPLVLLILFFLSYDMGFSIIPGIFVGEMFQTNVRSIGSTVTCTSAWLFGFGVSTAFGYMIDLIGGHGVFWIFSGFCAVAFTFTALFVPETRGKSLIEIQEMLSK